MATVPVTRTFVAGEVVLASYFNTNIRDVLNYLLAPPILECRQTAAQTFTTATYAPVTFTTEDVDSSGMHSTSSNTSRGTAVYPGYYQVSGAASFDTNATGARGCALAKNGAQINSGDKFGPPAGSPFVHTELSRVKLIFHNVSDYSEIWGYQSSGGNLGSPAGGTGGSSFTMVWESN